MLIKTADDKQPDIDALDDLLQRPDVDLATRRRIEQETRTIRAGAAGERDAAYEIDFQYGARPNHMVIHDLRLEVEGRVAQIDHLIINRVLEVWVCETKHFAEGVAINEHGEWSAFYGRQMRGIASPVVQNKKHIAVLADVFTKGIVRVPTRLGVKMKPDLRSLILVSNQARISRPKSKGAAPRVEGLETVVKVEQLKAAIDRDVDKIGIGSMVKLVSATTIERLAIDLAALHRPARFDWASRFGLPASSVNQPSDPPVRPSQASRTCASCGVAVSYGVARYSEAHSERFGGHVLCMSCQRLQPIERRER